MNYSSFRDADAFVASYSVRSMTIHDFYLSSVYSLVVLQDSNKPQAIEIHPRRKH